MFRIMILKDYYSQEEKEKKKNMALQELEAENKEQLDRIRKIDRKAESKIISQASKNFNIHLHS